MAKPMNRNQKIQVVNFMPRNSVPSAPQAGAIACSVRMSKVPFSSPPDLSQMATIATSISTEPASVNRKNLIAAYSRRLPPQMPMRKYIGSSMISQNT